MKASSCRVAIVGGGPSGLAVATELAKMGVDGVVLLEREQDAGGIPRHCGHSPFGFREFHRIMKGPGYASRLVRRAQQHGVSIRTGASVAKIVPAGGLVLSTDDGVERLKAEKVVICTGNRETPRSARLVSGSRPLGVMTTGALQSMVYLKHRRPFKRPLIVGTELVSFSALLTCRHAGIRPVAMIDNQSRVTTWQAAAWLPRLLGSRLLMNVELDEICGRERVESVKIRDTAGRVSSLDCDGVVFSGNFVAESSLIRGSHLELDARSGAPAVDQFGRCSDADYFACGNLLHPVDTAGWCWAEGQRIAAYVSASLDQTLPPAERSVTVETGSPWIKYFTPQRIALPDSFSAYYHPGLQLRFSENLQGRLSLRDERRNLVGHKIRVQPERRVLLSLPASESLSACESLTIEFTPSLEKVP
ncbi:MAG: NAD(P)/FAD-dependent oxidoreductase [Gammaproteobacteria bacterium]|nr:NAD(P)/FAD-dependent oxidoreductase [Gammaproteobacteria bacterium]MCP4980639.1 NAD(P)/FAD-dependent oxidoreductase [Gammaproteobacteria bacterium]